MVGVLFGLWSVVGGEFLVWSVVGGFYGRCGRWSVTNVVGGRCFAFLPGRWSVFIFENGRWSVS